MPEVQQVKFFRTIDCTTKPFIVKRNGWTIEEHLCYGALVVDLNNKNMYQLGERNTGYYLLEKLRELKDMVVLNACVLDDLLGHSWIIPDTWKGRNTYFFGTIYRSRKGNLCVRYLYWWRGKWRWNYSWLGNNFRSYSQVALCNLVA